MAYFPAVWKVLNAAVMIRPSIAVLNGPNLNMLGLRQPEIYGQATLDDLEQLCLQVAEELDLTIDFRQTNVEGELISWIQECRGRARGIVLNPAAYSHTSIGILDALLAVQVPTVEVHISNIHRRDDFRRHTYSSQGAIGVICGFGVRGYAMAIRALYDMIQDEDEQ